MKKKKTGNPYMGYVLLFLAGLMFAMGSYLHATQPAEEKFLVATDKLKGSGFEKSVILVFNHTRAGADGVVINKKDFGGPVDPDKVIVLYSNEVTVPHGNIMSKTGLGVAEGQAAAEALKAMKKKPVWSTVLHGTVVWGMNQLNDEIKRGEWKVVDYNQKILMDTKPSAMWVAANKL